MRSALLLLTMSAMVFAQAVPAASGQAVFNVRDYGATGKRTANDTGAINRAATLCSAAGGGTISFPPGTYVTNGIKLYSNCAYVGAGPGVTVIMLADHANADVFTGTVNGYGDVMVNYAAANHSGSSVGLHNWRIADLTIDGNNANQSANSYGIRQYGYNFKITDVHIQNTYSDCIYSDYNSAAPPDALAIGSIEAQVVNLKTYHCGIDSNNSKIFMQGAVGIRWGGPTDSHWTNIMTYQNASHGFMIGPNGGAMQIATLHSFGPHIGNRSVGGIFESGTAQCMNCEAEGSDTAQLVFLAGENVWSGRIFQTNGQGFNVVGIQLGQKDGDPTYAGVYFQQTPGSLTPTPGVAASSNGDFLAGRIFNCWGGGISFVNENKGDYFVSIETTKGAYAVGTPVATDSYDIHGYGLTCDGTLAKCGGHRTYSGNGACFNVGNGQKDLLNLNCTDKQSLELVNGAGLQLYSDNYSTESYGLGAGSHGLSYGGGAGGYIDSYATGGWKNGGGWALAPAPVQTPGNSATLLRNLGGQEWETLPVTPSNNITGTALEAGQTDGQQITIINQSAFTITFADASTSKVADGTGDTIAANRAATFRWLATPGMWYRAGSN